MRRTELPSHQALCSAQPYSGLKVGRETCNHTPFVPRTTGFIASSVVVDDEMLTNDDHIRLCAVMAQILSIYGLVTSVIISNNLFEKMALFTAFVQLGSGLAVGLCGMAAGFAIGIVGDAGGKILPAMYPVPQNASICQPRNLLTRRQ